MEAENQLGSGGGFRLGAFRGFFGVGMNFARPVTHFATRDVVLAGHRNAPVRRLFEFGELRVVTGAAPFRAYIFARRAGLEVHPGNRSWVLGLGLLLSKRNRSRQAQ